MGVVEGKSPEYFYKHLSEFQKADSESPEAQGFQMLTIPI